ncbi:MAG: hypothetical protein WC523_06275 [Patescibacteria group bacterium]|jgi:hypothetical protein
MKHLRLLPLAVAFILWLFDQVFFWQAQFFYIMLALGGILIIFSIKHLVEKNKTPDWLPLIVPPILFWLAGSLYVAIIPNAVWIQTIFLVEVWLIYSYLKNLYYHLAYAAPERIEKIDNLLLSGGFLSAFAFGSVLYGLPAFINTPFAILLLAFLPLAGLLFIQFWPYKKINWQRKRYFFGIVVLLLMEIAAVYYFLPLNFNILGLLLALSYYFLLTITRLFWQDELKRERLKLPLIFCALIFALVLLTSRWL